jgi:two-component system NarL family sensor kinase
MDIERLFIIGSISILVSLVALIWMFYSSHVSNRTLVIQRDQIHSLEIKSLEMDKLKSIASAEEEQMRRIGRYLHDEVGGNLHVLLHLLEKTDTTAEAIEEKLLHKAAEITRKSIQSVRITSQELVPYFLINFGLERTLQSMVDDAHELPGIHAYFSASLQWPLEHLPQDSSIQLYRLMQEVYSNLLRHAKPTEFSIHISTDKQGLQLSIMHNGMGLSQNDFERMLHAGKSLGLKNIDYRKQLLNAALTYQRQQDRSLIEIAIAMNNLQLQKTTQNSTIE